MTLVSIRRFGLHAFSVPEDASVMTEASFHLVDLVDLDI